MASNYRKMFPNPVPSFSTKKGVVEVEEIDDAPSSGRSREQILKELEDIRRMKKQLQEYKDKQKEERMKKALIERYDVRTAKKGGAVRSKKPKSYFSNY
jgi:hypothetical protein